MGAYISKQVKMHAYHLKFETLDNEFFKISYEKIPMESIKWKANLKWPKIEIVVGNIFENSSTWEGRP